MDYKKPQDPHWQKPLPGVNKLQNNLGFRQWRLSPLVGVSPRDFGTSMTRSSGDSHLMAIHPGYTWSLTDNAVHCTSDRRRHAMPGFDCSCGLYCSYSSSIIYDPGKLGLRLYCFGAVRFVREGSVFCEYGVRAIRADVAGILFHPSDGSNTNVQTLIRKLEAEYIPHTFSARKFLEWFPDPDYRQDLSYDPAKQLSEFSYIYEGRGEWSDNNLDEEFARPVRPEMLQAKKLGEYLEITIKPEYRPGGRLFRHPLLEVWPD